MPSAFAWLFDNPEASDLKLVITNQKAVHVTDKQSEGTKTGSSDEFITRTLNVHTLVLSSYSEYFRARNSRWQNQEELAPKRATRTGEHEGDDSGKGTKRTHDQMEEGAPKVVLRVQSADLVPLAEAMVKYMYLEELDQRTSILDLLKLLQLADEYGVGALISKCVKQAQDVDFEQWAVEAKLAAMRLPEPLLVNQDVKELVTTLKEHLWATFTSLRKAVTDRYWFSSDNPYSALVGHLMGEFLDLEAVWNDEEQRGKILNWAFAAVEELLGRNDLKVASENIVLVVALSWLRRQGSAVMNERGPQLLNKVRFPQLRPWMISLLIRASHSGPQDIRDLLSGGVMELVGYYLAADERGRGILHSDEPLCKDWGKPRQVATAQGTFEFTIRVPDFEQLAEDLVEDANKLESRRILLPTSRNIDGLRCSPVVWLDRDEHEPTSAALFIGMHLEVDVPGTPLVAGSSGVASSRGVASRFSASLSIAAFSSRLCCDEVVVFQVGNAVGYLFVSVIQDLQDPLMSVYTCGADDDAVGPFRLTFKVL